MKFSYNWLRELVPALDLDAPELMRQITMKTAECEGLEHAGPLLTEASTARVLIVEPIAGGHNFKTVVQTARYGIKTVVCGAPNCRPGIQTVYAPIGVKVIQGVESDGMLASGAELRINRDHSGILELTDAVFDLRPDYVIEVDNKSLTHRPDLWGHHGMAREVAAIASKLLLDPADTSLLPSGAAAIAVEIADLGLCPRYSALAFENVTVQPSPLWMQYRLESVGLNPINNIVDVTNYCMAELAQPMHAFDADRLQGSTIFVRPAHLGERLAALNGQTYELNPTNLVIADAAGAIALAGVIGGLDSAIGNGTRRIVLESATFQASSVRKTSTQLKLRTDASMRFEKSQDPHNTVRGLARAIALLQEVSPGIRLVGGLADRGAERKAPPPVDLSTAWLTRKLGIAVTSEQVRDILESLQFGVTETTSDTLSVQVPSWRATKDISLEDDLLEEVGRMIGYIKIPPAPPMVAATPPPSNPERSFHRRVRSAAAAQGFTEVSNYSFLSEAAAARFGLTSEEHLRVANPIASDQSLLRKTLLPGIFRNLEENSKHFATFRLFEIGREVHKKSESLPQEAPHLMAAIFEKEGDGSAGLFELKRLAECLLPNLTVAQAVAHPYEHPRRAAMLSASGEAFGRLFELHPSLGLEGRAAVLDLDLAILQRLSASDHKYWPLRRFPVSAFDLSVIAGLREPVGVVENHITEAAGADLSALEFVRQYVGAPFPDDRKSVSFRITVGAGDRTLSSEEVGAIRSRIIASLRDLGYELRA